MTQYFDNYTPVGDMTVIVICIVLFTLMRVTYITKSRHYTIFKTIVYVLPFAAIFDIIYHYFTIGSPIQHPLLVYIFRSLYHFTLYNILCLFVLYAIVLLSLNSVENRRPMIVATLAALFFTLFDVLGTVFRFGFFIRDGKIKNELGFVFPVAYIFLVSIIIYVVVKFRNMVFKMVLLGVSISVALSFLVIGLSQFFGQNSFTCVTFLFPIIAILYLIHANPYDISIGSVNRAGFEDMIKDYHQKGRHLILMSLFLPDYSGEGKKYPEEIRMQIREFTSNSFNGAVLFQVQNGHMILAGSLQTNPNYEQIVNRLLNHFQEVYPRFKKDYKIVITDTIDEISRNNEYVELLRYVHSIMDMNSVRKIQVEDIEAFRTHKFIVEQLEDICRTKNLRDERVAVYCQPVFNLSTNSYDTAEALMRLKLPHVGLVFPDQFIPVAEEMGLIHSLSLTIFYKTCQQIRNLIIAGYYVRRISVNFSVTELRDNDFCNDINRLITDCGIPSDKVAIEITESQNEADFNVIKEKIMELHTNGIKFYLDDFGTGYSNIERIMELPFDIIKFDRSLVIATATDKKSEMMVGSLANMFANMDYSVLYEGVETEKDEQNCINMSATYLQGYKYSRPIPIERLTEYFVRNGKKSGKEPNIGVDKLPEGNAPADKEKAKQEEKSGVRASEENAEEKSGVKASEENAEEKSGVKASVEKPEEQKPGDNGNLYSIKNNTAAGA